MEKIVNNLLRRVIDLSRPQKAAILLCVDVALVPISFFLTVWLYGGVLAELLATRPLMLMLLIGFMLAAAFGLSKALGLQRIKLNAYEQDGIQRTAAYAVGIGVFGFVGLIGLFDGAGFARSMLIYTMILIIVSVSTRIVMRNILVAIYQSGRRRQRLLIYGAGQTGAQLATALGRDDAVLPVAFVDDNATLQKMTVGGLPVHSPIRIEELVRDNSIDRVVLAMPSISRPKQAQIARKLKDIGCEVTVLPSFAALVGEKEGLDRMGAVKPSDFLNRANLETDLDGLCDVYCSKSVMITGAGGSIGSELVRQILACKPKRIVLFEISEFALYQLRRELVELGEASGIEIVSTLGSVMDAPFVARTIEAHEVEVVIHAAAYKHVSIVEENVLTGLRNNVFGTKVLAEAARDAGVTHFILISTDKAVRPTSVMGASKRFAEMVVQDLAARTETTRFAIVRFGNVLGSSGSVVPLFEEQIARGGPVTLTHPNVTRYFMTLSEAARLVLLAGNFTSNNDVFVLDMGSPVPILKLAQQMIEHAGYSVCDDENPDGDIKISIIGLSKGEKLHEELVTHRDGLIPTDHPKIMRASEDFLSELELASALKAMTAAIEAGSPEDAHAVVRRWVGDFRIDQDKLSGAVDTAT